MKRTFLIDSENINDIWVELLHCLEEKDEILVFYTDKSAHMGYDRIIRLMEQKKGSVRWIRCFEGQNALDFQLVTELGSRISQEPKREYTIVSNDTGYDAVVRYWQQKECRVQRMKGVECETLVGEAQDAAAKENTPEEKAPEEKLPEEKLPEENPRTERAAEKKLPVKRLPVKRLSVKKMSEESAEESRTGENTPEKAPKAEKETRFVPADSWRDELLRIFRGTGSQNEQGDIEFLTELCRTVKLSNMSLMHNVLEYHFGQETGNSIYHFIKENPGCRGELSAGYSNNKKQRERQYLSLILEHNHIVAEEGDEDAILKILGGIPRKNLNSLHTALVKKFGQEEGGNCYAVLRNHVKIIRAL